MLTSPPQLPGEFGLYLWRSPWGAVPGSHQVLYPALCGGWPTTPVRSFCYYRKQRLITKKLTRRLSRRQKNQRRRPDLEERETSQINLAWAVGCGGGRRWRPTRDHRRPRTQSPCQAVKRYLTGRRRNAKRPPAPADARRLCAPQHRCEVQQPRVVHIHYLAPETRQANRGLQAR